MENDGSKRIHTVRERERERDDNMLIRHDNTCFLMHINA